MSERRIEELRQEGLALQRSNDHERALAAFDEARGLAADELTREKLDIHRAFSLISLGEVEAREVRALPAIVMARRDPEHVTQAAYWLALKNRLDSDIPRARRYATIALEAVEETGREEWRIALMNELANLEMLDSRFDEARERYRDLLRLSADSDHFNRFFLLQNLGYTEIVSGNPATGVALIHEAIDTAADGEEAGYLAESWIDLCLGYLELERYEESRFWGEKGLEAATNDRQLRNAHYLLGEATYYLGDIEAAEGHFNHLCEHYPEFPQLKNLLYALDLRKVINWKL